jgi:hypothetical protein
MCLKRMEGTVQLIWNHFCDLAAASRFGNVKVVGDAKRRKTGDRGWRRRQFAV